MPAFDYLRISLSRPSLPELLEMAGVDERPMERRDWLRAAFSERRDFYYHKRQFSFVPKGKIDGFLTGFLGRDNTGRGRAGPDENFHEIRLENWELAFIALDLNADRQVALMQYNNRVGTTKAVLAAFLETVARGSGFKEWSPHVEWLFNESSFWDVAEEYRGQITRLKFEFVPPNALRADERVMDFIRDASEHAKAQSVTHQYDDPEGGLDPKGELIESSVNVASRGGGSAEIKVGRKKVFSDDKFHETEDVPSSEVPDPENELTISGFIRNFFRRLGDKGDSE